MLGKSMDMANGKLAREPAKEVTQSDTICLFKRIKPIYTIQGIF